MLGFGGPDTIIAMRTQVSNPFMFKYYETPEAAEAASQHQRSAGEDMDETGSTGDSHGAHVLAAQVIRFIFAYACLLFQAIVIDLPLDGCDAAGCWSFLACSLCLQHHSHREGIIDVKTLHNHL